MSVMPKHNIGDEVYFVESSCNYGLAVPCEMCFGKRKVTVILGNEERVESACGYCSHGIDSPSGQSKTWQPNASIGFGPIKGIRQGSEGWVYEIGYHTLNQDELFISREEAEPVMERRLEEERARRKLWERDSFINATKKQIWSVGYHRSQIADHKRRMAWHEMRLCMIKERES